MDANGAAVTDETILYQYLSFAELVALLRIGVKRIGVKDPLTPISRRGSRKILTPRRIWPLPVQSQRWPPCVPPRCFRYGCDRYRRGLRPRSQRKRSFLSRSCGKPGLEMDYWNYWKVGVLISPPLADDRREVVTCCSLEGLWVMGNEVRGKRVFDTDLPF